MAKVRHEIRISPMTRLYAAFELELKIDKAGILLPLREKYINRLNASEVKRDSIFRTVLILDAIIFVLISGKSLTIPILNIGTADLPGILEIATATSAVAVLFATIAFINWSSYNAIVSQYGITQSNQLIDPDFIQAAERHTELTQKLLRSKFNIWGVDFHEPGSGARAYFKVTDVLMKLLFLMFPLLHYWITFISLRETYKYIDWSFSYYVYFSIVIISNILSVLIAVGIYKDFRFVVEMEESAPDPKG